MSFTAQFHGVCVECEDRIEPGQIIRRKSTQPVKYAHEQCPDDLTALPPTKFQGTTLDEMGF